MCGTMALVELPPLRPPPPPQGAAADAAPAATIQQQQQREEREEEQGGSSSAVATSADAKWVQDCLHYQHRVEVPVKCVQGRLWVRISGGQGEGGGRVGEVREVRCYADTFDAIPP